MFVCCNKNYQHKFDEKLKERLFNAFNCSNHETSLPEKILK